MSTTRKLAVLTVFMFGAVYVGLTLVGKRMRADRLQNACCVNYEDGHLRSCGSEPEDDI